MAGRGRERGRESSRGSNRGNQGTTDMIAGPSSENNLATLQTALVTAVTSVFASMQSESGPPSSSKRKVSHNDDDDDDFEHSEKKFRRYLLYCGCGRSIKYLYINFY